MNEEQLPVVNFGKYKGKCISTLLADNDYIEWLKQQSWLENHKNIYNIIINQSISSNNNSNTPEHNKLQNLFLDKENQKKLINHFKLDNYEILKCIFEDKFNWDICLYTVSIINDDEFNLPKNVYNWICCELKTSLSDDYPCVLRKMKNQKLLMKSNDNYYNHFNDIFNYDLHSEFTEFNKIKFILLIESFTSKYTSNEELKEIFKQSNINVIFMEELDNINIKKYTYNELLNENNKLKELLQKYEESKI